MGVIVRSKPNGNRFLEGYPQFKQMLQQARCLEFVEKFDGHEKEVTKSFAKAYDRIEAEIGDVNLVLTESFVAEVAGLPRIGESWFNNGKIEEREWRVFLNNIGMDISEFKKGVPVTDFKNKWRNLLLIIQNFITFEGKFGNMFFYYARLMMNFLDGNEINLEYFSTSKLKKNRW